MIKSLQYIILFTSFLITGNVEAQLWKQYADSATIFRGQKKLDKAVEYYSKALQILKYDSTSKNYASVCDGLGYAYEAAGQFDKALPLIFQARRIWEKTLGKETVEYAKDCHELGYLHLKMGQFNKVEFFALEAKGIYARILGKQNILYANVCHNLGFSYLKTGQFQKADSLLLEVKQIKENISGRTSIEYAGVSSDLGLLYLNTQQYKKAEIIYTETKEIFERISGNKSLDYAFCCKNLASVYEKSRQYDKALLLYGEENEIIGKVLGKKNVDYAASCSRLAHAYQALGKYKNAEDLYLETVQIRKETLGPAHPDYSVACYDLIGFYYDLRQYVKAVPLMQEIRLIREKSLGKAHVLYAESCALLAVIYQRLRQYTNAEPLYLEAKQIQEKLLGNKSIPYASSCHDLGLLYKEMGQYQKSESLFHESIQIREKLLGKEHPDYISARNNLGALYVVMGLYEKAEPIYLETRQVRQKLSGKQNQYYASACDQLATLYYNKAHFDKAEQLYLEAMQIRKELLGNEHPDYAQSCNNLGCLYKEMGKYARAEQLHLEAMQIHKKVFGKEHPDYAVSCNNLATLYTYMGQFDKAEILYWEDLKIKGKVLGTNNADYALSCNNVGVLYLTTKKYLQAGPLLLEAKQIREKVLGKKHPDYAQSCNNLATLYYDTWQYEKADPLIREAMQIQQEIFGKDNPFYARSCQNLGLIYMSSGHYSKAELLLTEAKQIRGRIFGKQHPDYGSCCRDLGFLYWIMHQPLLAEKEFKEAFSVNAFNLFSIFQFTNEEEKTAFTTRILDEHDKAFSFYVSEKVNSEQLYSLSLFNRNLVISSSQALRKHVFAAGDSALTRKYNEWVNLKNELSILYSKPSNGNWQDLARIRDQAGEIEKEVTRLSIGSGFQYQKQSITWRTIQQDLKADEAAVEFVEFSYYNSKILTDSVLYIALVLRKDRPGPELVSLFEKKQLEKLLAAAGNDISTIYKRGSEEQETKVSGKSVYQLIWQPLEKHLAGIRKVYFAPAGILHLISFSALPINPSQTLSDKYKITQLNTTASVSDKTFNEINVSDKIVLYGGISYTVDSSTLKNEVRHFTMNNNTTRSLPEGITRGNKWQELKGTRLEIDGIKKEAATKYQVSVFSGINATEESIKSFNGRSSPSILHIATHGFFFPDIKEDKKEKFLRDFETSGKVFKQSGNPLLRSGILFAGANIAWQGKPLENIEDGILTSYEVSNIYLPNTKLVVLSACETALGDIKRSEGVYGLQRAFKMAGVHNLVMSLWKVPDTETAEFMQQFYKNMFLKQTISDAFYNAQKIMKDKYRDEPYKWAAWVLIR